MCKRDEVTSQYSRTRDNKPTAHFRKLVCNPAQPLCGIAIFPNPDTAEQCRRDPFPSSHLIERITHSTHVRAVRLQQSYNNNNNNSEQLRQICTRTNNITFQYPFHPPLHLSRPSYPTRRTYLHTPILNSPLYLRSSQPDL